MVKNKVTIVDYGLGNVRAFYNLYKRLNISVSIARTPEDLSKSTKLILPGEGSFDWAMEKLNNSGMLNKLNEMVLEKNIPVFGVCVGMQMMANSSEEGDLPGLGWIDAKVKKFTDTNQISELRLPLPHMGWNEVIPDYEHELFDNLHNPLFYFLHSYYFEPTNKEQTLACSFYGKNFASAAINKNVIGVQFHPEKSHHSGMQMLKNFSRMQ